eukprot:2906741-Alexandrium_andersonii.AAC.1
MAPTRWGGPLPAPRALAAQRRKVARLRQPPLVAFPPGRQPKQGGTLRPGALGHRRLAVAAPRSRVPGCRRSAREGAGLAPPSPRMPAVGGA